MATYVLKQTYSFKDLSGKHRNNLEKAIKIAERSLFISNLRLGAYIGKGKDRIRW